MKKIFAFNKLASLGLCILLSSTALAASSKEDLQDRIEAAKTVLDQIMAAQDKSIPMNILEQAYCVGVVPGLIKGAFVFGAQYGQGVVTCRTGHGWSAPVFIRMAGGSWGLQINQRREQGSGVKRFQQRYSQELFILLVLALYWQGGNINRA